MTSASGGFAPRPSPGNCPWTLLGTSVLQTPSMPTPGKNPVGAHGSFLSVIIWVIDRDGEGIPRADKQTSVWVCVSLCVCIHAWRTAFSAAARYFSLICMSPLSTAIRNAFPRRIISFELFKFPHQTASQAQQQDGLVWVFVGVVASSLQQLPVAKAPRFNSHKWAQTASVITLAWLVAVHTSNLLSLTPPASPGHGESLVVGGRTVLGGSITLCCVSVYKAWLIWRNHANSLTNYTIQRRHTDCADAFIRRRALAGGTYIQSFNVVVKLYPIVRQLLASNFARLLIIGLL